MRRRTIGFLVSLFIVALLAGAGGAALFGDRLRPPSPTAVERLERASTSPPLVRVEDGLLRSALVDIPLPAEAGSEPEQQARFFLRGYRELLAVDDPDTELALTDVRATPDGEQIVVFARQVAGVPVFGAELRVYINRDRHVTFVNGPLPTLVEIDPTPAIDAVGARQRARGELALDGEPSADEPEPALVIFDPALVADDRGEPAGVARGP